MTATKIAGTVFEIEDKYVEGQALNENEARALNGLRRENIRNNMAKPVKANAEAESPLSPKKLAAAVAEYATGYEFGAVIRGVSVDPVTRIALTLARKAIRAKLAAEGRKDDPAYDKEGIEAAAAKVIEAQAWFREEAQRQVDAKAASSDLGLDI